MSIKLPGDLSDLSFWREVLAEFLGVLILVVVGIGACFTWDSEHPPSITLVSLHSGFVVSIIVMCFIHVSGSHINPVVTISFVATSRISLSRAIAFPIAQCLGATAGAAILKTLVPADIAGHLGTLTLNSTVTKSQAFGVEFTITFILIFGIFAAVDENRVDNGGSVPLTIGLIITVNVYFAIHYTGACMNPARQFGPALVSGVWDDHWVYWIGPICGGVCGGLMYEYIFSAKASLSDTMKCFSCAKLGSSASTSEVDDEERRWQGARLGEDI